MAGDEHDTLETETEAAGTSKDSPAENETDASEAGTSARFRKEAGDGEEPTPTGADYS